MMKQSKWRRLRLWGAMATATVAGCTVGPDFKAPPAPSEGGYVTAPIVTTSRTPDTFAGESQQLHSGEEIAAQWWSVFHSTALNALIERSLRNNPDIKAAQAALSAAREGCWRKGALTTRAFRPALRSPGRELPQNCSRPRIQAHWTSVSILPRYPYRTSRTCSV